MKKRSYRAQKVNEVRWEGVAERVKDKAVVWAIDEVEQFGVLMDSERQVVVTLRWVHPAEAPTVLSTSRKRTQPPSERIRPPSNRPTTPALQDRESLSALRYTLCS